LVVAEQRLDQASVPLFGREVDPGDGAVDLMLGAVRPLLVAIDTGSSLAPKSRSGGRVTRYVATPFPPSKATTIVPITYTAPIVATTRAGDSNLGVLRRGKA
jgi:hypothetical protein